MKPFRIHHLLNLLNTYDDTRPIDRHIYEYFRANKALGSKDRAFIAETVYGMVRWLGRLEGNSWEDYYESWCNIDFDEKGLPPHIEVSFPEELFELINAAHTNAKEICVACNERAPTTLRANTLKTTREALLEAFEGSRPTDVAPNGVVLAEKQNLFGLDIFKQGHFEVQDEGSQLVAAMVQAKPGDQILDYCAGSGGKTLAIAPHMDGKGQIYLYDIRSHALSEAKKRLNRAGVQNWQILTKKSKKKMDWVLVDAPCTGTGTLRRNPDMKWKFSLEMLERIQGQQRTIFEKALSYVKPGGHIVYATCSILPQENEEQAAHFEKTYGLTPVDQFQSLPMPGKMDGFFGASWVKST